jgi:hypothetical protein
LSYWCGDDRAAAALRRDCDSSSSRGAPLHEADALECANLSLGKLLECGRCCDRRAPILRPSRPKNLWEEIPGARTPVARCRPSAGSAFPRHKRSPLPVNFTGTFRGERRVTTGVFCSSV